MDPLASLFSAEIAERLCRLALLARRMPTSRRRGRRRLRRVGGSADFIDTRAYAPGDDPRRIAWPAYARLERLLVRLAADESPLRLALVIDTSASMAHTPSGGVRHPGTPSKLVQAARIAAGLATVALSSEDRVAAVATSGAAAGATPLLRATGGRHGLGRLYAALDRLTPAGTTDLKAAAGAVTQACPGRALCVLVSDFFDPAGAIEGARALANRGHEVALVEVLDPDELDPPDHFEVDLEDEETGEIVVLPGAGARARYLEALAQHRAEVDEAALALGAPVIRVSTATAFDEVVARAMGAGLLRGGALP